MTFVTPYCECGDITRIYVKNRLRKTLDQGVVYCARFFVNVGNNATAGVDGFGAVFIDSSIDTITNFRRPLSYLTPQINNPKFNFLTDTLGWAVVNGTFVATGNEKFMIIGNVKSDDSTNTIPISPNYSQIKAQDALIDDISCIPMNLSAYAGPDVSIIPGDSVYLGRESDIEIDESCQWFKLPNDSIAIDTIAGLWVKPTVKTTYVVKQQLWCSGVKWDTVTVHINNVGFSENSIKNISLYPNPTNSDLRLTIEGLMGKGINISVYDLLGKKYNLPIEKVSTNEYLLKTDDLANGTYLIKVNGRAVSKRFTVLR